MNMPLATISETIWDMKYRLKGPDARPIDLTIRDTWNRVANALAEVEDEPARWAPVFYAALDQYRYLPAGRIIAGAGTERDVTLFNCYVMGTIPDSMDGIFSMLREAALTMQQGGGIGYDFSTLRPKGAPVRGVAADASGPLSFMDVWDSMCRTIMSAGSRRGAMMATMRCDHPDIEDFITAKRDPARLRMFNLSVLATDEFMLAVKEDSEWPLHFNGTFYKTVSARALWNLIMQSTYDYAEPGVIFIDRINRENNLRYCETITSTNPCGEQPLPPYGACLLGSLNLTQFIEYPFQPDAGIDIAGLREKTRVAVRMMDNVIDVSRYPLEAQEFEAKAKRRIGLGITGLADALAMLGLPYHHEKARQQAGHIMREITVAAYQASIDLAREKGAFPAFDADKYLDSGFACRLPDNIRGMIAEHGIRNALLTSIAPTGTISLFGGNVSSGIEPIFSAYYDRKILLPDGTHRTERVEDYAVSLYRTMHGLEDEEDFDYAGLPPEFVTAQDLHPNDHIDMQAAVQPWIDAAVSKTVNVPVDFSFPEFHAVYRRAYESGVCKGCTTYRPNEVTGSILSVQSNPVAAPVPDLPPRPEALESRTYKLKWPESAHAIYVTISDITDEAGRRPFEVFVNSKSMEHYAWTVALTRMLSAIFRRGGDITFVIEELKAIFDPRGGAWVKGRYVPSILAALGGVIERHMVDIGYLKAEAGSISTEPPLTGAAIPKLFCPKCASANMAAQSGCTVCRDCGHSTCE